MPNTRSAKKRLRQNEKRRLLNRGHRSSLRTAVRKLREAIAAGDQQKALQLYPATQKKIDQVAAKGIIHKNAAARLKSRLVAAMKKAAA